MLTHTFTKLFKLYKFCNISMDKPTLIREQKNPNRVTLDLSLLDTPQPSPIFDCLIILNYRFQEWVLSKFINLAKVVIATDGGANYLYHSKFRDISTLHSIIGDLDSLTPDIRAYYQKKVNIQHSTCQDTNDFMKGIKLANELNLRSVVSIGTLGGRIDQELCNLNAIEMYSRLFPQRFIALGPSSLMFLIKDEEESEIKIGKSCLRKQVGMFCFGQSKVDTTGFKWNLNSKEVQLEWGKLISSSNVIESEQVTIKTEKQMFFTIELDKKAELDQM